MIDPTKEWVQQSRGQIERLAETKKFCLERQMESNTELGQECWRLLGELAGGILDSTLERLKKETETAMVNSCEVENE